MLDDAQEMIDSGRIIPRGKINIINQSINEVPQLQRLVINTSPEDRECCIITYASFNKSYPRLLEQLLKSLKQTFRGHVLYRVGGWPNMEVGCLRHCDVPYGFKACAFKEAFELGYNKVLWLDSLVESLKDLRPIFEHIEKQLCVYRYSFYSFKDNINKEILNDFEVAFKDIKKCSHIAASILGFNFKSRIAVAAMHEWHDSVERKRSFYSNFPEQIPLSIILNKYRLDNRAFGSKLVTFSANTDKTFFFRLNYARK